MKWYISVLTLLSCYIIFICAESNQCPDGKTSCPNASTCCHLGDGNFGCCPIQNAVCCEDSIHCCPEGYTCDAKKGICRIGGESVPLLKKIPAMPTSNEVADDVVCPGGEGQCPADHSCCFVPAGSDQYTFHCCPSGLSCEEGVCRETKHEFPAAMVTRPSDKVVKCNQKFACPDRYTCCKTDQGYECCPLAEAVCCSDNKHCCPRGFKCSPDGQTCSSEANSIPALSTTPPTSLIKGLNRLLQLITKTVYKELLSHNGEQPKLPKFIKDKVLKNVICPDGQSQCPDGMTCCKLTSGQWGCCPIPNAVCCKGGEHCCPRGYTCDSAAGTCIKGMKTVPMLQKIAASKRTDKVNVVCPDGQSECPDGMTCCKLASGGWGCCPLLKAVCCSDEVHCCPNGYTCNVANGSCSRDSESIPMLHKISALQTYTRVNNVVCPGGQSQCPDGNTCCKLSSGQYGCCPLPKAVCCSDEVHCCPSGYTCDTSTGTCIKGMKTVPMLQKIAASKRTDKVNVVCPDGQSECPDGMTCCKLASGEWGCCPLPKAVCCSDEVHCCPNGYTCNVANGSCSRDSESIPMLQKISALQTYTRVNNVVCPGGQSQCPDGNTCCKLSSGQYGCCPLPKAVCCSDEVHCCPSGYTCDTSTGTCIKGMKTVPMLQKIAASKRTDKVNVVCPDGQSECPDGMTCCKLASGEWGCCPLPKAVCCSDEVHCCPNGYTCNVANGSCSRDSESIPMLQKISALQTYTRVNNVVCPGGQSQCPDGNTCCKLSSGQYGCCPLPKAVCCSDEVHCCPSGYTCDTSTGTCIKGMKTVPMLQKIAASKRTDKVNVVCPDGQSECPDGMTCCKLASGEWGCCPLPKAVCCSDEVHCCPNGYTCNVANGSCSRDSESIPMLQKISALQTYTRVNNVVCPGGQSQCPDGNTCCKLSSGQYGCCPLPKAVCCSDEVHCCPSGYTCDTSTGTCIKGMKTVPMLQKIAASKRTDKVNVVCPDGQSECPDGMTCCKLASGEWGCCPLPKAVCCSDEVHCCPNGYTCNVANGSCSRDSESIPMLQKISALQTYTRVNNVVCPGGQSQCPDGTTCCKLVSGQYGCCPLPKAVCCSDEVHCCPNGYTCNVASGSCSRDSESIPMLHKIRGLQKYASLNNVICPGDIWQCPDGSTCCKLASVQWACCPLSNAVCCKGGEHCCPSGHTCDSAAGTCIKGIKTVPMLQKIPASKRTDKVNVVCPDGQSQCADGYTCCKLPSGQYGCCPLPNAVCCKDGNHCCPEGYTCDTGAGTCIKGSTAVQSPVLKKIVSVNVVCAGGQSQCPTGSTCCKLVSGEWGCCPLPNAVCCKDEEHCCPEGYTCDIGAGTCIKGSTTVQIPVLKKIVSVNVVCPGGQSQCPDGNMCCKLYSGQYGCCPLPNAVCCSDGLHCCPSGYTCDTSAGTCIKGIKTVPLLQKIAASKRTDKVNVVCPDGQSECPDGTTCCKLTSGQWGCCPLPNAVCCKDGKHCCPEGYTCDTGAGTCNRGIKTVPMLQKIPASKRTADVNIVCPDGQSQCPDGNTCCKLASGQYGCCSLPNAVCCKDGEHCCPEGYICDTGAGTCIKGSTTVQIPVLKKIVSVNVVCPGGHSQCPTGSTCCKLVSGEWGCCPLPRAVCCSDGVHCCPESTTCDVSTGQCKRHSDMINLSIIQPTKEVGEHANTVFCNDGESECPNGYTCCRDLSGQYACCPVENATCCSDKVHCCPQGYTCNLNGTCHKNSEQLIQRLISLAVLSAQPVTKSFGSILCPDKKHQCPSGSTCCKLHSGSYGCCPIEKAVCCNDDKHCCPEGYTCDVKQGICNKQGEEINMMDNVPVVRLNTEDYVQCPDGSECLNFETCCTMSGGSYGCCPLPHAVCCEDQVHCCPCGYRCDVVSKSCVAGSVHIPMLKKTKTAHRRQKPQKVNLDEKIRFIPGDSHDVEDVVLHP